MGDTSFAPGALRRIVRHVDEMSSGPYRDDEATAMRLAVMRRRAAVRVETAATELATAAGQRDAPPELRALARSVRAGNLTWEQCVSGKADDRPEVRVWLGTTEQPSGVHDDEDDYADESPLRRD